MTSLRTSFSNAFHRYLRVPYPLHVHEWQSPKKPRATIVFIHGIGNTLHSWDEVVKQLPDDVRLIGVDLLGFGKSPRPDWAVYNAKTQARSLGITLLGLRMAHQPILVGHSLGALVCVEVAKRYSLLPRRLVLCSPPFYRPSVDGKRISSGDDMLRQLYRVAKKYPERLETLSPLAVKFGLANKTLNITQDNVGSYLGALEASIINQTALQDVTRLKMPIDILYGALDPVVIKRNITRLAKHKDNVTAKLLITGHEVTGSFVKSLAKHLSDVEKITER